MHIPCRRDRNAQFLGGMDDIFQNGDQTVIVERGRFIQKMRIVSRRLDLDIIIEFHAFFEFLLRTVAGGLENFAVVTTGSYQTVTAVFLDFTAHDTRFRRNLGFLFTAVIRQASGQIIRMGQRHQVINLFDAVLILCDHVQMIRMILLENFLRLNIVEIPQGALSPVLGFLQQFFKHLA